MFGRRRNVSSKADVCLVFAACTPRCGEHNRWSGPPPPFTGRLVYSPQPHRRGLSFSVIGAVGCGTLWSSLSSDCRPGRQRTDRGNRHSYSAACEKRAGLATGCAKRTRRAAGSNAGLGASARLSPVLNHITTYCLFRARVSSPWRGESKAPLRQPRGLRFCGQKIRCVSCQNCPVGPKSARHLRRFVEWPSLRLGGSHVERSSPL
jgi:hypothetical protein